MLKNFIQKITLIVLLVLPIFFVASSAKAVTTPSDKSMNYVYALDDKKGCQPNDIVFYDKIISAGGKPQGCLSLSSKDNDGYSKSALPPPSSFSPNTYCGQGGGAGTTEYTVKTIYGWACVSVTDSSRWSDTCYVNPSASDCSVSAGNSDSSTSDNCQAVGTKINLKGTCIDRGRGWSTGFGDCPSSSTDCGIIERYINPLIRLLSAAVGVIVVIMIIIGGIQYSIAGGDPSKVAAAKKRIFNGIFALVAFFMLFAILNWILPGGLL